MATQDPSAAASGAVHETVLDTGTQRVARVYAEALYRAAQQHGQVDELLEQLEALVGGAFGKDSQLEAFLTSGAVGRARKADVIEKGFRGRADDLLVNFLLVLNDHERLGILRSLVSVYRELRDERSGHVRVRVESAVPLADDQRRRLGDRLKSILNKEPVLETKVNPDLLGGVVVQVGDLVMDHSVRTQLDDLRNQILERSSHEIQSGRDRFRSDD